MEALEAIYTRRSTRKFQNKMVPKETVKEIAKDLCIFFNQESVLITKDEIETFFFSERLDKNV